MNRNIHFTPDSASNLFGSDINASPPKSKESMNKTMKVKELFNRDLNKSILKLCSEADLRIKVLLSNTSSPVTSTSSKFSTKESTSLLHTLTKTSLLDTATKSLTLGTSKHSSRKSPKQKVSRSQEDASVSCHFNTEIDTIDDQANKQLTVVKILKITDLASKIEKRKSTLIKSKFETIALQRSYLDGLEEGYRYGYFDNPNDDLKTQSEITGKTDDTTYNDFDKVILKDTELELAERMNKSERMRAGFQDLQQNESRLMNKIDPDVERKETQIHITKSSGVTITNEYPSKCDEDVNVEAFNQKYELSTAKDEKSKQTNENGFTAKDLHGGEQYLQYFEKMLTSVGEDFAKGFRLGFRDGYVAANVFNSTVKTFTDDEKEYLSQMRKCLKFSEENLDNDIKKLHARAEEMKRKLNIPADEFEDISQLMQKGANKKIPLKFSKNDHKYYIDASKRDREYMKIKSTYEDDSDIIFTSYADASDFIPQHTKNRAGKYLKKHRINELFQFLGSHLVASKPEDPISFLINLLDKCIEYRFNECIIPAPLLFTKKHVESVYYVLDPMVTGYIDLAQYVHGMEALGLRDLEDLTTFRPGEKIDKYVFITTACRRLICKFRQMIAMDTITAHPSKAAYTNVEAT